MILFGSDLVSLVDYIIAKLANLMKEAYQLIDKKIREYRLESRDGLSFYLYSINFYLLSLLYNLYSNYHPKNK